MADIICLKRMISDVNKSMKIINNKHENFHQQLPFNVIVLFKCFFYNKYLKFYFIFEKIKYIMLGNSHRVVSIKFVICNIRKIQK